EYSGGSSLGWMGAFGLDFNANNKLAIYVELTSINQSWGPTKYEWNIVSTNGNQAVIDAGSTVLVDQLPAGASGEDLVFTQPFSSIAINAGVKIFLGSK